MGTLGFEESDVNSLLLLSRAFGVGADQTGQFMDIESDLRRAPLIIHESGCNANTKTVSTPREKLQDKLALDRRKGLILKREDASLFKSACIRLSYLVQDRSDLPETANHMVQWMSEPREFDSIPLKRAARYLLGKPKAALRFRRQEHVDQITVFVDIDFSCDPVSRKSATGLVAQIGKHTVNSGSTLETLTVLSVGEAEFYSVVKGGQVGLSLRSKCSDLGSQMKVGIQSDSLTAKSLTDRLWAKSRTKHIARRWYSQRKIVQML